MSRELPPAMQHLASLQQRVCYSFNYLVIIVYKIVQYKHNWLLVLGKEPYYLRLSNIFFFSSSVMVAIRSCAC